MDEAFRDLKEPASAIAGLRPATDGQWHTFEVLSHICGWHLRSADRLRRLARGEGDNPPSDEDAQNAGYVAERRNLTRDQLIAELASSYLELRLAVEATPNADFWRGGPGEEDSLAYFVALANGPGHYHEHMADLTSRR